MKSINYRITMLLVLVIFLTSCRSSGEPMPCSDIVETRLLGNPAAKLGFDEGVQWVHNTFSTEPAIEDYGIRNDYYQYLLRWQQNDREYTMGYREGSWKSISVTWQHKLPTIQDTFRCIGAPAYYDAFYDQFPEATFTGVSFWYPERGLIIGGSYPEPRKSFTERTTLSGINYSAFGTLEDLVLDTHIVQPGSVELERILVQIKPWPGGLEEIAIDETR